MRFVIQYMNTEGERASATMKADDEAAALATLLDTFGEEIAEQSPFIIAREGVSFLPQGGHHERRERRASPVLA